MKKIVCVDPNGGRTIEHPVGRITECVTGVPVELPDAMADALLEQPDVWQPAKKTTAKDGD